MNDSPFLMGAQGVYYTDLSWKTNLQVIKVTKLHQCGFWKVPTFLCCHDSDVVPGRVLPVQELSRSNDSTDGFNIEIHPFVFSAIDEIPKYRRESMNTA